MKICQLTWKVQQIKLFGNRLAIQTNEDLSVHMGSTTSKIIWKYNLDFF